MSLGTQLTQPPADGITRVQFAPQDSSKLLVAGWDKALRLHDVDNNTCLATHTTAAPLLDVVLGDHDTMVAYSGAVDGGVRRYAALCWMTCLVPTKHHAMSYTAGMTWKLVQQHCLVSMKKQ